ncbi:EAL domain-containing protein [Rubrivivax albus]|uniref:EAL domain-containing protein n=2 Tax=Rubrivivax albus TaxID=2499835 RepID=A0A437JMP9_9BURK|nr:EAL domain-containing protein [Rubrivivax albus]
MSAQPPAAPEPLPAAPWRRLHAALMPDYNRPATVYWWCVVALGASALLWSVFRVAALPGALGLQVLAGCVVTMLAGLFPVRIPGSNNSFAAGEIFIILVLLVYGPEAAVLAAACETGVGALRTSKRWTSRIVSPAASALSMLVMGTALHVCIDALPPGAIGEASVLVLAMAFAVAHFVQNMLLITLVLHLKARQRLDMRAFFSSFGWVGTSYAASALIAGLLYLAFRTTGIGVMAGAVPIIIVLLVMLHYHFRQRESDDEAQRLRIEAAEREAEQAARHLQALRASEQRFHSAFSHAAIGMALVQPDGRVLQVNAALCALLGSDEATLLRRPFQSVVHPEDVDLLQRQWRDVGSPRGSDATVELRCVPTDGRALHVALHSGQFADDDAAEPCLILQVQDITARRQAEAQLQHIAYHDGLTALANRIRFGQCLAQAIERGHREPGYAFAVMYLDFDRFKLINDTLGHSAGDRFLTQVAKRIQAQVRPCDTVGRLGGDEFAVLVDNLGDESALLAMAERLQQVLAKPYALDGTEVTSSASIGITFSSVGYETPGDVLRDADIAMYRAKAAGRARTALFDASLRAQLASQVNLERDLRRALEQQQLSLAFQPIYDLASGRVDSFEALVRWQHPERGAVPPSTFIPIAEESALIGQLTEWVLRHACAQLRAFERDLPPGHARPRLHVNVSGTDMCRANFVSQVAAALLSNGLEPGQLTLEITESTLMQRLDNALDVMGRLRELGVGLSVDDFGTGYSSLAYLSTLPITSLKIDRSFVQRLQDQTSDAEVVKAVITLGHALGKTVIAEGIETPDQLAQLRALGCGLGQGYLLARPLSPEAASAVVAVERRWPGPDARPSDFARFTPTGFSDSALTVH